MKNAILLLTGIILFAATKLSWAQDLVQYKDIDTTRLFLEVHYPEKMDQSKSYPALIFFFGGGWINGNRSQFRPQATYFAQRGIVCFLADYRTRSKNGTTPFESLCDAKSAIRYIREHAQTFGIDPAKIIASGGSAGGHLAAATAMTELFNDSTDHLNISCKPNALILFNPVFDNSQGGTGYERIGEAYKDFSPLHNIKQGNPPTLLILGTNDQHLPVETASYFTVAMHRAGNKCELKLYKGKEHGFFNYSHTKYYKKTLMDADLFLQSLGYLAKTPKIKIE